MIIHFTLNGAPQELTVNPGENVQKLLFNMGMHSVRNSDDGFGFAGSDAIIFNGNIWRLCAGEACDAQRYIAATFAGKLIPSSLCVSCICSPQSLTSVSSRGSQTCAALMQLE